MAFCSVSRHGLNGYGLAAIFKQQWLDSYLFFELYCDPLFRLVEYDRRPRVRELQEGLCVEQLDADAQRRAARVGGSFAYEKTRHSKIGLLLSHEPSI